MTPKDRYIILRRGHPVYSTNEVTLVVAWLWGRDIRDQYVVLDYDHPYPVDTQDLLTWVEPLKASA